MTNPVGVVAFDLDGTLLPNTTVCVHLAPFVGHHAIAELEQLYAQGRMTNSEVAELDAPFYKNHRRGDLCRQLESLEFIGGLPETVAWLNSRSLAPVVATVTHRFAADFVSERFGFAAASGCEMEEDDDGVMLGRLVSPYEPEDKMRFVSDVAQGFGLGLDDVVAIGDSTSDLPLFDAAGLSIALNASSNARAAADIEFDTHDLRDLIPTIDRYFSRARPAT